MLYLVSEMLFLYDIKELLVINIYTGREEIIVGTNLVDSETEKHKSIIFVLGMHRSGTSLTAQILSELGLYMGDREDMFNPDEANRDGYFEIEEAVLLNDEILLENNMIWCCIKENVLNLHTTKETTIKDFIIKFCKKAGSKNIAIKDPRFCLVEPFWRKELINLGIDFKAVVVVRHPYEVAKSIVRRDNIDFNYGLKIWFYYNVCILNIVIQYTNENVLFLNYDNFFCSNNEINKIVTFCNIQDSIDIQKSVVKKELCHNSSDDVNYEDNGLHHFIFELYNYIIQISNGESVLEKGKIEKFNSYLKIIANTSYEHNGKDMFFKALDGCHQPYLKNLLYNLLQKEKEKIKAFFAVFFNKRCISRIILYGYGIIAKEILSIIKDIDVECVGIIDKSFSDNMSDVKKRILLYNRLPEKVIKNTYILNTVVNYEDEISGLCFSSQFREKYVSVKEVVYEFYKEKKNNNYGDYNICI